MATYHGITKAICINCGKITIDDLELEILNDLDPTCRTCETHAVAWHSKDGIVITAQKTTNEDSDIERLAILEKEEYEPKKITIEQLEKVKTILNNQKGE
jgi:hypothetical protein